MNRLGCKILRVFEDDSRCRYSTEKWRSTTGKHRDFAAKFPLSAFCLYPWEFKVIISAVIMNRIHTIDFTRGLVMVIMALDHIRDLLHTTALTQSPTDLNTTTTAGIFATRWITHLCAPTFVFC